VVVELNAHSLRNTLY